MVKEVYVINPDSGRCVKASGPTGKKVLKKYSSPKSCKPGEKKGAKRPVRKTSPKSAKKASAKKASPKGKKKSCKDPRKSPIGKNGRCVLRASQKKGAKRPVRRTSPKSAKKASAKKGSPKSTKKKGKTCKDPRKAPTGKNGRCVLRASQKKKKSPVRYNPVPRGAAPASKPAPRRAWRRNYRNPKPKISTGVKGVAQQLGVENITTTTSLMTSKRVSKKEEELVKRYNYTLPVGVDVKKVLKNDDKTYAAICTFEGKDYVGKFAEVFRDDSFGEILIQQIFHAYGLGPPIVYAEYFKGRNNKKYIFIMMEMLPMMVLDYLRKDRTKDELNVLTAQIHDMIRAMCELNLVHGDMHWDNFGFDKDGNLQMIDFGWAISSNVCKPLVEYLQLVSTIFLIDNRKNRTYLYNNLFKVLEKAGYTGATASDSYAKIRAAYVREHKKYYTNDFNPNAIKVVEHFTKRADGDDFLSHGEKFPVRDSAYGRPWETKIYEVSLFDEEKELY